MNILITGGAGYIGSHLSVLLTQKGYNIIIYDNFINSWPSIIKKIQKITKRKVVCIKGDILNTNKVKEVLKKYKIDIVIHLAGLKAVGESYLNSNEYYLNNVCGSISLATAMIKSKVNKIIFSSSATVYGKPNYLPLDEKHPIKPISPYADTKVKIEQILKNIADANSDWSVCCLRYFNPVGCHESNTIKENPKGIPNNLMPFLTKVVKNKISKLKIFGNNYNTKDGTGVRDYIHITDLIEGHFSSINFLKKNRGWHAINLGTGKGYTVLEVIKAFEKVSGKTINYKYTKRRNGDVDSYYADTKKAFKLLKWKSNKSLLEMCLSAINQTKKNIKL